MATASQPRALPKHLPNIEIMPSGVPQSFYLQPSVFHDAQLRAALVELHSTLERYTHQPMNPDATPLIETAVHEIKKNRLLLGEKLDTIVTNEIISNTNTSSTHSGVTLSGNSPISLPNYPNTAADNKNTNPSDINYQSVMDMAMDMDDDIDDTAIDFNIDWDDI